MGKGVSEQWSHMMPAVGYTPFLEPAELGIRFSSTAHVLWHTTGTQPWCSTDGTGPGQPRSTRSCVGACNWEWSFAHGLVRSNVVSSIRLSRGVRLSKSDLVELHLSRNGEMSTSQKVWKLVLNLSIQKMLGLGRASSASGRMTVTSKHSPGVFNKPLDKDAKGDVWS